MWTWRRGVSSDTVQLRDKKAHGLFEARYKGKVIAHVYNLPMGMILVSSSHMTPNTQLLADVDAMDLFLIALSYEVDALLT